MADKKINTSNIFEEFVDNESLKEEIKKEKEDKDILYYVKFFGKFLQTIFLVGLLLALILYAYIYVEENTEDQNISFLNPVCSIFIGDVDLKGEDCISINNLNKKYSKEISDLKEKQSDKILSLLSQIYEIDNFIKTKEIIFLLNKSQNKLKTLEIMEKFDDLKISYNTIEKDQIKCGGMKINKANNILTIQCEAFSSDFENGIRGFSSEQTDKIRGTSITIANSFLNYIEKKSDFFELIDKQKIFNSKRILGNDTNFTQKTPFTLKLKYNL